MKKILHLIPTLGGGGAERQLTILVTEQVKRGWSVHVGVRRGEIYESNVRQSGAYIHRLGNWRGINPGLIYSIWKLRERIMPDIIQTWLPQMDICGGAVAKFSGIPWVMTERSSHGSYDKHFITTTLRTFVGEYADKLVANSNLGAEYWMTRIRRPKDIRVIRNVVPIDEIFRAVPRNLCFRDTNIPTLLMVGSLVESKGHKRFLAAVDEVAREFDVQALIVGNGPLKNELEYTVAKLSCADRVRMEPFLVDWWGLLKSCTALVSPSTVEGQPNVVLEAMAGGCPLIVSDIPSHKEFLDPSSAILVPVDDASALAHAICLHLREPLQAQRRAQKAFERVQSFTKEATASAYEQVYRECI